MEDIEPSQPVSKNLRQPSTEYMDLIVSKDNRKAQIAGSGADYAPPLTRSWEVPRCHVNIEKIIGKGAFGQVAKGTAVGLRGSPETTTVAIKMLKSELLYCKLNESWPTDIQEMLPGYCNYLAICHFISYVVIPTFRILFPLTKFYFLFLMLQQTLLNRTREI